MFEDLLRAYLETGFQNYQLTILYKADIIFPAKRRRLQQNINGKRAEVAELADAVV